VARTVIEKQTGRSVRHTIKAPGSLVAEALCYKPEGRGLETGKYN
jgi:hypothetical protein